MTGSDASTDTPVGADSGPKAVPRLLDRLQSLAEASDTVTLGQLTDEIGAQGHAPLLMIVALLMVLPTGMIPGMGGALGTIIAIIGLQMILGRTGVFIPAFLGRRGIPAKRISAAAERVRPAAEWIGRTLRPRWEPLSQGKLSIKIIAAILVLTGGSLLVLGAIPVAAPLVGIPIALFAFGILTRDGGLVAAGYALVLCLCVGLTLIPLGQG